MSFSVDGSGRMWVLDQVNGRIQRYGKDGKVESTIDVERPNAQDIAVGPNGTAAVLDRFGEGDVAIYDEHGNLTGTLPLEGEGVETAGHVTGVFFDGEDVYVETEHGPLTKIGDVTGAPAEPRQNILGRPTRDGKSYIKAGITDGPAGRAYVVSNVRPSGEHRFTRELRLGAPIWMIQLLDTDLSGTIYFAAEIEEQDSDNVVVLVCLDPATGEPLGSALLPANTMPEESFRDFSVLDGGGVVYAHRTEEGVTYEHYTCD